MKLSGIGDKPVILNFEGVSHTAGTGILLMREIGEQTGLIRAMAGVIPGMPVMSDTPSPAF
ncbi:MAG: hypothetical protein V2I97_16265 [Desulfococcaceae bacterium]|nr:hypothetical protein [Desulfococcaceae bacterium]